MKKIKLLLMLGCLLLVGAFTFSACEEKEYNPEILSQLAVTPTDISVKSERNNPNTIKIVSDKAWTATCDSSWVHLSKNTGNGDDELTVTVDNSLVKVARTATVVIKTDNITREITITQAAYRETITLAPATASVKASRDTVIALITANLEVAGISTNSDIYSSGTGLSTNKDTLFVYVAENPTAAQRVSTLTIRGAGASSATTGTLSITQAAASIKAPKNLVTIPAAGDTAEYVITANVAWDVSQSGDPAFELERDENIITIGVPANTTGQPRSARFIFKQALPAGTVADTINLIQYAAGASIAVIPSTTDVFSATGGNLDVTVLATQDWTYAFNPGTATAWAQVQQKKDSSGLSIKVLANTSATARSATVTLTSLDQTASASFTISQKEGLKTETLYFNNFNTQTAVDELTLIDKDGDGHNWMRLNVGVIAMVSESYDVMNEPSTGAYTPENYLVAPGINVPADARSLTIKWIAYKMDNTYYWEKHKLIVSTVPITVANCSSLPAARIWTGVPANAWEGLTFTDVTALAGQTIYIAIAHYDCTDQLALVIDDFTVEAVVPL